MACGNCSSGSCSTGACGKMNVYDWLEDMANPLDFDVVEIKFKGGRKAFYRNVHNINLHTGDAVIIEANPGHHLGFVSMQGELVRLQMKRKKVEYNEEIPVIYRIAGNKDVEKYEQSKKREMPTMFRAREIINESKLEMKLSDVEYQADNTKATFYYSADDRVDFRELIKKLASEFRIRVEMRQISLRQEAGRLGGIGSCGRELCCSTWLSEFKSVSTSAARYQNLSLNPSKMSGQCGRLKCCLNYELETYMEALEVMPEVKKSIQTESGLAKIQKTDIFKKIMWFSIDNDSNWISISTERVFELLALIDEGKTPYSLEKDSFEEVDDKAINNDLLKLDKRLKKKAVKEKALKRAKNKAFKSKTGGAKSRTNAPDTNKKSNQHKRKDNKDRDNAKNKPEEKPQNTSRKSNKPKKRSNKPRKKGDSPSKKSSTT